MKKAAINYCDRCGKALTKGAFYTQRSILKILEPKQISHTGFRSGQCWFSKSFNSIWTASLCEQCKEQALKVLNAFMDSSRENNVG